MSTKLLVANLVLFIMGCNQTEAPHDTPASVQIRSTSADNSNTNSNINVRNRSGATATPLDQGEGQQDVSTTADIRKQIIAAKLSMDAQNTKIITRDGKVTLRGPVQSAEEKLRVAQIAAAVAGSDNVNDQLEIKTQ
jgi:hyperosmotically inducible protein